MNKRLKLSIITVFSIVLVGCGNNEAVVSELEAKLAESESKVTELETTLTRSETKLTEVEEKINEFNGAISKEPIEIKVVTDGMGYKPNTITVQKGVPFILTLENNQNILHDLQIDSVDFFRQVSLEPKEKPEKPGVHLHAEAGTKASQVLIATKEGSYEIYCMVPGHKESGMVATLIVE